MFDCPVIQEAQDILNISNDLSRALGRLRKKLNHCQQCQYKGNCPGIENFQKMILEAIREVSQELNLVP